MTKAGVHSKQKKKAASRHAKTISTKHDSSWLPDWSPYVLLGLGVLCFLLARLQLLPIPMERDEAGFAYIGHWLLRGKSMYLDLVDNKLPGLYMLYAFFTEAFGYNATGVHIGLLISNVVTAVCFYIMVRSQFNRFVAALSTAFLLLMLVSNTVGGFAAHATQLLLPFVMAGWLIFWKAIQSGKWIHFFIAGLLLGFAFLVKQQSILFGILAALLWWPIRLKWNKHQEKNIPFSEWLALGLGGLLPVVVTVAYFALTSRLDELFFWTYTQPSRLAAAFQTSPIDFFMTNFPKVIGHYSAIWISAAIGLILIWWTDFKMSIKFFAFFFAVFGMISVSVGAAFYKHYFVLALPGAALMAAISLHWLATKTGKQGTTLSYALALIVMAWPLIAMKEYFFDPDIARIHQQAYSDNMFPEAERIGHELSRRVPEGEKIGILGSEPEILVAANREGCSKHLFMYPLLSDRISSPAMQHEYLNEMIKCAPRFVVWNTTIKSWAMNYDQLEFFKRLVQWLNENYTTSGIAEFRLDKPGEVVWDEALPAFQQENNLRIYVFERKSSQ